MVWATWEQCEKSLGWRYWSVAAVSSRAFDVIGEWDMVGMLRDNVFVLLCLMYTARICHLVML